MSYVIGVFGSFCVLLEGMWYILCVVGKVLRVSFLLKEF